MSRPIIDVNAGIGEGRPEESRPMAAALREMDAAGVACAWAHPPEACVAARNREGNDLIAEVVKAHPDRFIGCAVANPWLGEEAAAELRRAFDRGLRVLYLATQLQGVLLIDPLLDPLIRVAVDYRAPIYACAATPVYAMPFQLAYLARRHPDATFILGRMGFPDFWTDGVPAAAMCPNILLETAQIGEDMILKAIDTVGVERVVFGSDIPNSRYAPELAKLYRCPALAEHLDPILAGNARRLLA